LQLPFSSDIKKAPEGLNYKLVKTTFLNQV
jgi:hypothetical protein